MDVVICVHLCLVQVVPKNNATIIQGTTWSEDFVVMPCEVKRSNANLTPVMRRVLTR